MAQEPVDRAQRRIGVARSQRSPALVPLAVGVLLFVAACGSETGSAPSTSSEGEPSSGNAAEPQWSRQVLRAQAGPDLPLLTAADGDQVVVAVVDDDGVMAGFATDGEGRFEAGKPTATGKRILSLGGVTHFEDGWVTVGSGGAFDEEKLRFDVLAFRSADGRTWTEVDTTGLDGPADVTGVATVDGGLVAVGTLRTANEPAQGGFRPVAWHSADGQLWTTVSLPMAGGTEGSAQAVIETGGEVLAVGNVDGKGTMWSSTDGGASWEVVERDGIPPTSSMSSIIAQDEVLLVSAMTGGGEGDGEGGQILLRSTDGGRRWREAAQPPPPNRGEGIAFPLYSGGGLFFTLGYSFIDAFAEPELCYAAIELCQQDRTVALYLSDDGDRWKRVDTSGIGEGDAGEVDTITATDDGRIVALTRVATGIRTWTWPAGSRLPTTDEPSDPSTDVELLGEDEKPEPGRRYGALLFIHCGMDWLYLGGEAWRRTDDGPDIETGAGDGIPDDWPVAQQTIFGFVTLVSDDLIEYSIGDGDVIATYVPATKRPPGCA